MPALALRGLVISALLLQLVATSGCTAVGLVIGAAAASRDRVAFDPSDPARTAAPAVGRSVQVDTKDGDKARGVLEAASNRVPLVRSSEDVISIPPNQVSSLYTVNAGHPVLVRSSDW